MSADRRFDCIAGKIVRRRALGSDRTNLPPGTKLIRQLAARRVILWDVAAGREQKALTDVGDATRLAVSPVGDMLVISRPDGTIRLWDPMGGRWKATFQAFPADHTRQPSSVALAFSPDGKTLATGAMTEDFPTNLWDVAHNPP